MELSLRLKKSVILLLTLSVVALLLGVGGNMLATLRNIQSLWHAHSDEATLHLSEINEIRHHFGYGGFIHNFNSHLLHLDAPSRQRSEASLVKLMQAISKAEKLHLTPLERLALAEIRRTAEEYREQYLLARVLIDAGKLPHEIAPRLQVADQGAIDAFRLLSDIAVQRERKAEADADRRISNAIGTALWGVLLIPLVLLLALLLWRFLNQVVQANTALARVTRELDAIIDNAPDAMITVLADGSIVRANEQAEQLFGYSREQLARMSVEQLVPEAGQREHAHLRETFMSSAGGHKSAQGRLLTALTRAGREVPVEIGLSVLEYEGEVRAIATIRDVTERVRAQQEIEQLNRSLQAQNQELESFSYSVSHDLRTPLRSIEGFSQLVERHYADRLDGSGRDYLQRIRRAALRMGHLIDDLLQLSRVSRAELKPRYLNISSIVEEILREYAEASPERTLCSQVESGVYGVADSGLLRVVLDNLLGNAWKYSGTREQSVLEFGVVTREGESVYFVCDNGIGFDMRYADKLFGAFQRLHGVEEFEGTGIGLSTVQRIVQRHGGRIWAESKPDEGACFYFTLGAVDERVLCAAGE